MCWKNKTFLCLMRPLFRVNILLKSGIKSYYYMEQQKKVY